MRRPRGEGAVSPKKRRRALGEREGVREEEATAFGPEDESDDAVPVALVSSARPGPWTARVRALDDARLARLERESKPGSYVSGRTARERYVPRFLHESDLSACEKNKDGAYAERDLLSMARHRRAAAGASRLGVRYLNRLSELDARIQEETHRESRLDAWYASDEIRTFLLPADLASFEVFCLSAGRPRAEPSWTLVRELSRAQAEMEKFCPKWTHGKLRVLSLFFSDAAPIGSPAEARTALLASFEASRRAATVLRACSSHLVSFLQTSDRCVFGKSLGPWVEEASVASGIAGVRAEITATAARSTGLSTHEVHARCAALIAGCAQRVVQNEWLFSIRTACWCVHNALVKTRAELERDCLPRAPSALGFRLAGGAAYVRGAYVGALEELRAGLRVAQACEQSSRSIRAQLDLLRLKALQLAPAAATPLEEEEEAARDAAWRAAAAAVLGLRPQGG